MDFKQWDGFVTPCHPHVYFGIEVKCRIRRLKQINWHDERDTMPHCRLFR